MIILVFNNTVGRTGGRYTYCTGRIQIKSNQMIIVDRTGGGHTERMDSAEAEEIKVGQTRS